MKKKVFNPREAEKALKRRRLDLNKLLKEHFQRRDPEQEQER